MSRLSQVKHWLLDPEPPGVGVEFRPGEIVIARFDEGGRGEMDLCLRAPIPPGVVDFSMLRPNLIEPEALAAFIQKLFDEAFRDYKKGREALSRSLPGMKGAHQQRRRALVNFESSLARMEQILAQVDHHPEAMQLRSKLSLMIQTCIKDLGFFD